MRKVVLTSYVLAAILLLTTVSAAVAADFSSEESDLTLWECEQFEHVDASDDDLEHEYDFAFYHTSKANKEYFMFDTVNNRVVHFYQKRNSFFGTPVYGTYTGEFLSGIEVLIDGRESAIKMKGENGSGKLAELSSDGGVFKWFLPIGVVEVEKYLYNPK